MRFKGDSKTKLADIATGSAAIIIEKMERLLSLGQGEVSKLLISHNFCEVESECQQLIKIFYVQIDRKVYDN